MKKIFLIFFLVIFIINCRIKKTVKQSPVLINKICTNGLPMGDIRIYNHLIYVPENDLGYIRVRSVPIWDITRTENVLGTIKCGQYLPAWGPTKNIPSAGIGYIIPIVDKNGNTCRGYVSLTVIEIIKKNYYNKGEYFNGFPEPLGF